MKAIVLAAGVGRRMGLSIPKSMVDMGGRSIIHRQLDAFRANGIEDFVIVIGFGRDELIKHLQDQPGRFTFIVNERYLETNTIYSLHLAAGNFDGGFYYANADVVLDHRLIRRLAEAEIDNALAVRFGACATEEVKVTVSGDRVTSIGKDLDPKQCRGEFIGVARFSPDLAPEFAEVLASKIEREGRVQDYFEDALGILSQQWVLAPVDISDLPCIEIDFPEDLERARREVAPRLLD